MSLSLIKISKLLIVIPIKRKVGQIYNLMPGKTSKRGGKDKKTQEQMDDNQFEDTRTKADSEITTQDNTVLDDSVNQSKVEIHPTDDAHTHAPETTKEEDKAHHSDADVSHKHDDKPVETHAHVEPSKVETHETQPEVAPEEKHEPVPTPAPKEPEVHVEPPKPTPQPEEPPKSATKATVEPHHEPVHHDEHQSDHTSSFVKIGDSIPPQPDHHDHVAHHDHHADHGDSHTKDIAAVTPPAHTPKDLAAPASRDHSQEPHVPENTPVVAHPALTGDAAHLREPVHAHKADLTHSGIPHPPIPDPPIVEPPVIVNLGNDKPAPQRDDKIGGHPVEPKGDRHDAGASNYWLYGVAVVAVGAVAFMKWKKIF